MTVKIPTDDDLRKAIEDGIKRSYKDFVSTDFKANAEKTINRRLPGNGFLFNHVKEASRQLASLREEEVRQIEAGGRKVTRIEVDHHGHETMVVEPKAATSLENIVVKMTVDLGDEPMRTLDDDVIIVDDPQFKVIDGPHMYKPDCYCMNCSGWRQKQNAGMHINTEMVATEVELMVQRANDEWQRGGYKGECLDPIMHLPCSVVMALCEQTATVKPDYCAEFALDLQNKALRREIAELKEGTLTNKGLAAAIQAGTRRDDMFPGAVGGVSYSQETGNPLISYNYSCACGIHHSNQTFPQGTPFCGHSCPCGKATVVWDTERKG